ncbi:tRNA (N6-threonylcarbamoyladenosine(37)-N6)-methyltransferase TrmO [Aquisalimonas asiatica]|uniref:tRNA-Thr(GGU) m(6)t(6)A37 methyltransferase TsaA n=1 Tax=Aquisalimonas asiatica TaxID=406100 RepID=A0A1H8QLZ7_9GAMM|nr:tRNA (N6-threonylcarbamoyladenosine(37)-N6)-methyltransferase TrmO [Aquisalimonas asiatica]SEO54957.1 tRNA-Thr(GGU) m(6)t(6)A37 methyltransferase TsaA [Aquisalimonas asiatica]
MEPIGIVHSCFDERFGTPRQPGLVPAATARLELLPPFDAADVLRGLEGFSHVWILYRFHANQHDRWSPTVRPPRLGGNTRTGVLATRSPFRPNPIGLSVVELEAVVVGREWRGLRLRNHDLVDGTPVLDIKPYLPYADSIPDAVTPDAFAAEGGRLDVVFAPELLHEPPANDGGWRRLVEQSLATDPRPAFREQDDTREYGVSIEGYNVRFRVGKDRRVQVVAIGR